MLVVDPRITCRISRVLRTDTYTTGITEIVGECSLTGKTVIRYVDSDQNVFEFDEKTEDWIPISAGVCKNYFNKFAAVCLPKYSDNIIEYKKREE